jgi:two-component system chemotaxis sensor kinase CheA
VNHAFRKFPKMVRDLSAEKKKPVKLEILGKETELDKGIVDGLGEPLAHIVRNMIDHGIEAPVERARAGKPAEGVITFRAYHEASMIVIEASDDGAGIDLEKLKLKAVEQALLNREAAAAMSDAAAVNLIFLCGLSTADAVTGTSGRGVGMDAVKSAVEDMRGTIEIYSMPGKGTTMRLRLPLTLAVIKGLLFEAGDQLYALPVSVIAEVAKVTSDALVTVNGRKTLLLRDKIISVISVQELFHLEAGSEGKKFVLVVEAGGKSIGLLVDRLLGQQELVIKAIDDLSMQSRLVAGAALLGTGKIVMILDVLAVARKAVDEDRQGQASA